MAKTFYFSKSQLQDYRRHAREYAVLRRAQKLHVDYARSKGGLTLDVWRLKKGPWFGEPQVVVGVEAIAETLQVPVSEVTRVLEETHNALSPQLQEMAPDIAKFQRDVSRKYGRKRRRK
jgi:hypothetical protein